MHLQPVSSGCFASVALGGASALPEKAAGRIYIGQQELLPGVGAGDVAKLVLVLLVTLYEEVSEVLNVFLHRKKASASGIWQLGT